MRELLYPLGFLALIPFATRFLWQWVASEMQQESIVPKAFWRLSLVGHALLLFHSLIQLQFHVSVVQACNGILSFRNLNLMQEKKKHFSLKTVLFLLPLAVLAVTALFLAQTLFSEHAITWFRVPTKGIDVTFLWHFLGTFGLLLFSSRSWVQWIQSEREGASVMSRAFWWISLSGNFLCLLYFTKIADPVNMIGPVFGIIPSVRNLILIRKRAA